MVSSVNYWFISGIKGIWWFLPELFFFCGFQWWIIGLYPELRVFGGLLSELGFWMFSVVENRFISDNLVLYPVVGSLLPELGISVVSSG